jgi:hypothetical protein
VKTFAFARSELQVLLLSLRSFLIGGGLMPLNDNPMNGRHVMTKGLSMYQNQFLSD